MHRLWIVFFLLFGLLVGVVNPVYGQSEDGKVIAVLFFSPTCPHCHKVITEDLPPLQEKYGDQFEVLFVDVRTQDGSDLFYAACSIYDIPNCGSVPTMIVNDTYMVGSSDIPARLPDLIETGLASGGYSLPPIPGLQAAYDTAIDPNQTPTAVTTSATPNTPHTWQDRFKEDTAGNSLAVVVLLILIASLVVLLTSGLQSHTAPHALDWLNGKTGWMVKLALAVLTVIVLLTLIAEQDGITLATVLSIATTLIMAIVVGLLGSSNQQGAINLPYRLFPLVAVAGLLVAGYLTYVEVGENEAVCGAVGDCNAVQQSEYAELFGIPIGVLGVVGYLGLMAAWLVSQNHAENVARFGQLGMLVLTLFGVAFSIYLTYLEPFVIGASCAWCLTSALVMTLLLWLQFADGWRSTFNLPATKPHRTLRHI